MVFTTKLLHVLGNLALFFLRQFLSRTGFKFNLSQEPISISHSWMTMQWNHLPLPFSVGPTSNLLRAIRGSRKPNLQVATTRARHFYKFATLKTRRKLGRVSFCKDFWDRFRGRARLRIGEKKGGGIGERSPFPLPRPPLGSLCSPIFFPIWPCFLPFPPPRSLVPGYGRASQLLANLFALSPVTVPAVLAQDNSTQFLSRL